MRAGTLQPEEEKALRDLISEYKYFKGGCNGDVARLFLVVPSDTTRGNGHKVKHSGFLPSIGKGFFPVRVAGHWHS